MKNKYCWSVILVAMFLIGGTAVRAQAQTRAPKPKTAPVTKAPPPPPATTRSADISSTDFGDKKTPESSKLKGETADREPGKYVRRCRKYVSRKTKKTYWRCRNVPTA